MTLATGKGGRYRYYKCNTRIAKNNHDCDTPAIPMEKLDTLVLQALADKVDRVVEVVASSRLARGCYLRHLIHEHREVVEILPACHRDRTPLKQHPPLHKNHRIRIDYCDRPKLSV